MGGRKISALLPKSIIAFCDGVIIAEQIFFYEKGLLYLHGQPVHA